jgi:hypothetical protein
MEKNKTPKERGTEELNKKLGKEIAKRMLEIKKHQAQIKRLEKEIDKIESGELVPDCEDENPIVTLKPAPITSTSPYRSTSSPYRQTYI